MPFVPLALVALALLTVLFVVHRVRAATPKYARRFGGRLDRSAAGDRSTMPPAPSTAPALDETDTDPDGPFSLDPVAAGVVVSAESPVVIVVGDGSDEAEVDDLDLGAL